MCREIKSIDLYFENCEILTIDRKDIGRFWCDKIAESVSRIADNSITNRRCCKEFFLEIHKNANQTYDFYEVPDKVFERISKYQDITSVGINYDDETSDEIYLPWKNADECGENNMWQSSFISKLGNMYIYARKNKRVEDVVDFDEVNDPDIMEMYWRMFCPATKEKEVQPQ